MPVLATPCTISWTSLDCSRGCANAAWRRFYSIAPFRQVQKRVRFTCGVPTAETSKTVLVLADGLSALAIDRHALPLVDSLARHGVMSEAPVCVVRNGRVAIGDEVGELLGSALTVLLIGERPGLSAPDSLGVYLTSHPRVGRTDAERNCISNIRLEGLGYDEAAKRIASYLRASELHGGTGYALKEADSPNTFMIG